MTRDLKAIAQMANADIALENARFPTSDRVEAFSLMKELNELSEVREIEGKKFKTCWRVGIRIKDRIVFDLDNHNEKNLKEVLSFYEGYFKDKFTVIKTLHGYHLIGSNRYDSDTWMWHVAETLMPGIPKREVKTYIEAINKFYEDRKEKTIIDLGLVRKRFKENKDKWIEDFKESGLCYPVGNFDVLHTTVSLTRHRYILRISKKTKNDKIEVIT